MRKPRKTDSSNIKFLDHKEILQLFFKVESDRTRLARRNKAIIFLAKYCALRASEIGLIEFNDYDPAINTIHCRRLKGSNSNTLKIVDPIIIAALNDFYFEECQNRISGKLFLSQKGTPINRRTLDKMFKKYCSNTIIPEDKRHFHVLKHSRAMELIEYTSVVNIRDVQWWLGHKNISNTMKYLNYTSTAMQKLFDALTSIEGNNQEELKWQQENPESQ